MNLVTYSHVCSKSLWEYLLQWDLVQTTHKAKLLHITVLQQTCPNLSFCFGSNPEYSNNCTTSLWPIKRGFILIRYTDVYFYSARATNLPLTSTCNQLQIWEFLIWGPNFYMVENYLSLVIIPTFLAFHTIPFNPKLRGNLNKLLIK